MSKILITGASGFIGSHLSMRMADEVNAVFAISHAEMANIRDTQLKIRSIQPDYIFHLASYGNHSKQVDEEKTIEANIMRLFLILKMTEEIDYKAFVNFSTSSVQLPHQTFYSATKAGGEYLCRAFAQKYNKKVISVRPASVFGEGEADFRFIPTVIKTMIDGCAMNLDPFASHSWIYVGDFVDGLLHIIKHLDRVGEEPINISYGKEWKNIEIVEFIEQLTKKKLQYNLVEHQRAYDNTSWLVDNEVVEHLGWRPPFGLEKGLLNTFKWYRDEYQK